MNEITPTEQQLAAVAATKNSNDSILLEAYAGCAKTTTLTLMAKEVKIPSLALAFNVSIAKELRSRFPTNFSVQTMNGLGYASLMRAMPHVNFTVDAHDKKLGKIIRDVLKDYKTSVDADQYDSLRDIVRQCMIQGLVPNEIPAKQRLLADNESNWTALMENAGVGEADMPMVEELAREILTRDINDALRGFVSFDDQIYVSTLVAGRFPKFPSVLGDEIQDFSPLNHAMLVESVRPDGRLLMVGDRRQGIYAFRGADANSIAKIKALRSKWIELPLTQTFRVPQVIVNRQLGHAPGFVAAPSNRKGLFVRLPLASALSPDPDELPKWNWSNVAAVTPSGARVAVLCRNNAPLLKLAFKLLRQRKSVTILGRDIGRGIVGLTKQLSPSDFTPKLTLAALVTDWEEREKALALANGHEEKLDGIEDRAECIRAVLSYPEVDTAGEARRELNKLFANENGAITLSSIHKAKGMEWDVVVLLDPWRMPSKWARDRAKLGDDSELQQEFNLKYVAETRTKEVLVHASMEDFE